MENEETKLVRKKKTKIKVGKLSKLFEDKKKRYIFMFLFILPFLVAIGIFANIALKEVRGIMDMAKGTTEEVKDENKITSMNYVLRDNATDIQKEYFAELKNAIEVDGADEETIAGLIGKNFVADFYTWSNKQGQFDVGGLYYVTEGEFASDGTGVKENVFLKARDSFYKFISNYINEYGAENLLQVESVTVISSNKAANKYFMSEHVSNLQDENGDWYDYREDQAYDAYNVSLNWAYVPNEKFSPSKYPTKINLLVIERGGRFEIAQMSSSPIDVNVLNSTSATTNETDENTEETAGEANETE